MKVVIDTSVLFQAVYSSAGASYRILQLVRTSELQMQLSVLVFEEYCDVLTRESSLVLFGKTADEMRPLLDFIAYIGNHADIFFLLRPNLKDENDNIFMELAFASRAEFIITSNVRDFLSNADLKTPGIRICTPSEFLRSYKEHKI